MDMHYEDLPFTLHEQEMNDNARLPDHISCRIDGESTESSPNLYATFAARPTNTKRRSSNIGNFTRPSLIRS